MAKIISGSILRRPLEAILEERKLLDRENLQSLVKRSAAENVALEEILLNDNLIGSENLFKAIAESYGLPYQDLKEYSKPDSIGSTILDNCRRSKLLPISLHRGLLTIATSKPALINQVEGQFLDLGLRVRFVVSSPELLEKFLASMESATPADSMMSGLTNLASGFDGTPDDKTGVHRAVDLTDNPDLPSVVQMVNKTLITAVTQRSSDIHIESTETGIRIRFRIDGVMADRLELAGNPANAFVSRVMVMAGLDITERMMPQDGSFKGAYDRREIEFRIASMPGLYGQNIVLRILSGASKEVVTLANLGLREEDRALLDRYIHYPHGLVLVSGPTGSGKSTTLYAMLETLSDPTLKIITIEDPAERRMDRVQQIQVRLNRNDPERSLTFARGLRSILRLDPDIIMVGEIRDRETAEIAVQASLTGHMVLSTVHANSAIETLRRMQNMGVDSYLMLMSINLLIAQRLMRRLCLKCRKPRPLSVREKTSFANPPPEQLYEHGSCENCLQTGYHGRIGIYEFLPITEKLREAAAGSADRAGVDRKFLHRDLLSSALAYVSEGVTDLDELVRVLGPCL